jgi:hypothetical protein
MANSSDVFSWLPENVDVKKLLFLISKVTVPTKHLRMAKCGSGQNFRIKNPDQVKTSESETAGTINIGLYKQI